MDGEARRIDGRKRGRKLESEGAEFCDRDPAPAEKRRVWGSDLNCGSGGLGLEERKVLRCLAESRCSSGSGSSEETAPVEEQEEDGDGEVEEECSRSRDVEGEDDLGSETESQRRLHSDSSSSDRETTPSRGQRGNELEGMEETTALTRISGQNPERRSTSGRMTRTRPVPTPSEAEIEEFFAEAETTERTRFAEKYNFDVEKETPLEGRYEWVRIKP